MTLAPASTSTSLIAPASSLTSGAGRSARTENAASRLLSTLADRATDGSASSVAASAHRAQLSEGVATGREAGDEPATHTRVAHSRRVNRAAGVSQSPTLV